FASSPRPCRSDSTIGFCEEKLRHNRFPCLGSFVYCQIDEEQIKKFKLKWEQDYGRQSALKGFSQPLVNKIVLMVFYNVICASNEDGGSNLDTLSDIRNLDWCTFVWDCLKDKKSQKLIIVDLSHFSCLFTCIAQNAMR
nr:hypothetical protein [Tanacetum cinerariifolium]